MPQGLQIFNSSGVEIASTERTIGRVFGVYAMPRNIQSGTITDSRFGDATPFFFFIGTAFEITISISGNVLSWSRTGGTQASTAIWGYLYYGTYA